MKELLECGYSYVPMSLKIGGQCFGKIQLVSQVGANTS